MRRRRILFLATLVLCAVSVVAARRHSVRFTGPVAMPTAEAQWLYDNSFAVGSVEPVSYILDLEPLRGMIGNASIVGLGDATHGTRQFTTAKQRIIEFLAQEMNFDLVVFEAPYAIMDRVDAYVQGGNDDPRALLKYMGEIAFGFHDTEETLAMIEWARQYNAFRGQRPALHFVGMDLYDPIGAAAEVVAFLRVADPSYAVTAEASYACLPKFPLRADSACVAKTTAVRDNIASRGAELTARSSAAAYDEGLFAANNVLHAQIINPANREPLIFANVLWMRDHRSVTKKMIVWAHDAHVARTSSPFLSQQPMGSQLAKQFGSDYYSIGMFTGSGTYIVFGRDANGAFYPVTRTVPALTPEHFETLFRQRGASAFLLNVNGTRPTFFPERGRLNLDGSGDVPSAGIGDNMPLWDMYDAVLYIDQTTAMHPLQH